MEFFLFLAYAGLCILFVWLLSVQSRVRFLEKQLMNKHLTDSAPVPQSQPEVDAVIPEEPEETEERMEQIAPTPIVHKKKDSQSFEQHIGGNWFQWLGIGALVIALLFFTQWTIANGYIGPRMQITLAYIVSAGGLYAGTKLLKKYGTWALTFCGGGMLAGFITTWVALHVYGLIPPVLAFGLFIVFTIITCGIAAKHSALPLAVFSILGAFITPLLTGADGTTLQLMTYLVILNVGVLYLAYKQRWNALNMLSFVCTILWGFMLYSQGRKCLLRHCVHCTDFKYVLVDSGVI